MGDWLELGAWVWGGSAGVEEGAETGWTSCYSKYYTGQPTKDVPTRTSFDTFHSPCTKCRKRRLKQKPINQKQHVPGNSSAFFLFCFFVALDTAHNREPLSGLPKTSNQNTRSSLVFHVCLRLEHRINLIV